MPAKQPLLVIACDPAEANRLRSAMHLWLNAGLIV
jgi:hypothetical protein